MTVIDKSKPILVTGASGYIASWIVRFLLEEGYSVRGTVRDPSNDTKTAHLRRLAEKGPGKLELVKADLLDEGSFDEAARGCELLMHTASPVIIGSPKNPQKALIEPALEGTKNVLNAANQSGTVKRVVLTSSVAAIYGYAKELKEKNKEAFTEEDWNNVASLSYQPYSYSKTLAEKEAWEISDSQDRWDLVVINPAVVMGPALSKRKDTVSVGVMIGMLKGKYKMGLPDLNLEIVDVRDVAKAHILAGFTPKASGRHIASSEILTLLEIAQVLRDHLGKKYPIPSRTLPKWLLYLFGPSKGLSWKYIRNNVGFRNCLDTSYIKRDLGMTFRPAAEAIRDHADQLIKDGMV